MTDIATLQQQWNKKGYVSIDQRHGLTIVHLDSGNNSSSSVYLHGGHVISFKTNSSEHLFTSEKSVFTSGKAIRGGVPIIFPQFGPGKIQTHGFARNTEWAIHDTFVDSVNQCVGVDLQLVDNDYTRSIWDYSFKCIYSVVLFADRLELRFTTTNTDQKPWDFQLAFHTYYQVSQISNVHVEGLYQVEYIDKMRNLIVEKEARKNVVIGEEVDRVYLDTKQPVTIVDTKSSIKLTSSQSLPDAVVWNPWIEKSKKMEDFGDLEYLQMICIEAGVINRPPLIEPGHSFQSIHTITPINNPTSSL
ncbi:aldose 1-epimerase family protein [Cavenderia fasciculata]|uniref:glucose-6-phosphate 1-epimerase n=1 Tax=Cavenderia fasciculata TaxID=261658 RepID=F4PXF3_CACFS|nr:aldose 1-epimerase family protein [Cavenderia fasciculata]EGG19463.1 aldose 1-epimerase family protein [Cavenderia fasciculata]|eukprot:XP_004357757.1 aldose 1-epimerase family protein [Cavenderia fasciculata]